MYHCALFPLEEGLSRYLLAARDVCNSAKDGALFPIKAYSSREIPSGRRRATVGFRAREVEAVVEELARGSSRMERTSDLVAISKVYRG